jgi:hypothetical protein
MPWYTDARPRLVQRSPLSQVWSSVRTRTQDPSSPEMPVNNERYHPSTSASFCRCTPDLTSAFWCGSTEPRSWPLSSASEHGGLRSRDKTAVAVSETQTAHCCFGRAIAWLCWILCGTSMQQRCGPTAVWSGSPPALSGTRLAEAGKRRRAAISGAKLRERGACTQTPALGNCLGLCISLSSLTIL